MTPLLSSVSRYFRQSRLGRGFTCTVNRRARRQQLCLEALETRTVPTAVAVPSGLVSWWQAQNSAVDLMGLNNATLVNGATYAAGEVGQAFKFDGVNDRVQVADSASLAFTASFTIDAWIKVNAFGSNSGKILFRGDDRGGLDPYSLSVEPDGTLSFQVTPDAGSGSNLRTPISLGQFTHVAATLDDATGSMSLYVNGILAAQTATYVRPFANLDPSSNPGVGIGNVNGSFYNSPFNGLIDELSVYNRALNPGEVLGIFKAGSAGKVNSAVAVDGPSVIEGSAGTTTPVTFTIQRTGSLSGSLTVTFATADDSAVASSDYVASSGSVTFADGEATKTVQVTVSGDNLGEASETVRLIVTPAGGTSILGVATILNDDSAISISNASSTEGDATIRYFDDFLPVQSRLAGGRQSAFGPDGNFYVATRFTNDVQKFDGKTGAFLSTVIPSGHGLLAPWALTFGPDGNLFVSGTSHNVVRYSLTTGGVDEFLPSLGSQGTPGLTFDAAGNLYVIQSGPDSSVLRFQGPNGASPGAPLPAPGQSGSVFVAPASGGLNSAQHLAFGPDGNLYVCSHDSMVNRYSGTTGAFIDTFVTAGSGGLDGPMYVAFRPDGFLYVASQNDAAVYRYDAITGAFNSKIIQNPNPYGDASSLAWDANGNLIVAFNIGTNMQHRYARYGVALQEAFTVTLDHASALPISVSYFTADDTAMSGSDYMAVTSGTVFFAPGETSKTILIQTVDDATIESAETFAISLANPIGATITSGTGIATILDNDSTKFFVVDDASTDRTYRYGLPGNALANSTLGSGDTAPRGAASTAAGTMLWVADANSSVYVYSSAGALLGSWAAGGLPKNATVEGIATNGTDVWIVANSTSKDKVFKYTGAASRLSGTQSAASSFGLNSADTTPKGIVTDGTWLWLVDDGTATDKVFKYTLTGSYLGSWTIDPANTHPTGLTINPTSVSDIWIVDNGTDKVYQYAAAAGRISGSQNAAATFALAASNTNPQDIADPPAPDMAPIASGGLVPEALSNDVHQLPESLATFTVPTLSRSPEFLSWLTQLTPTQATLFGGTSEPAAQSPATVFAQASLPSLPAMKLTSEAGVSPGWIPSSQHRLVDQVFCDIALGSIDMELLSKSPAPGQ